MKSREFIRTVLLPAGAELEKKDGSHHIYRLPSGRMLLVPVGGSKTEISPYLESKFRRLMRDEGRKTG
ncbi:MAG TPA: type II toxin-antitoxin system HicA family toxin [Candidatus Krumholzibacteria bacterium]